MTDASDPPSYEPSGATPRTVHEERITVLLRSAADGDSQAANELFDAVYAELRGLAGAIFAGRANATLQPTALVHEAWLKLERHLGDFEGRAHFFRTAARAMRQVLANYAESARAAKRDGRRVEVSTMGDLSQSNATFEAVVLDDALTKLAGLQERHARVVELRFLCALTIQETAEALGVSHGTVEKDWAMARAWLLAELGAA